MDSPWFGRREGTDPIMSGTTKACLMHLWKESKSNGYLFDIVKAMMDFAEIPEDSVRLARYYLSGERRPLGIRRIRIQSFLDRLNYDVVEFRHFALLREALVFNKITLQEVGKALDLPNEKAVVQVLERDIDLENKTDAKIFKILTNLIRELDEQTHMENMSIDEITASDYVDARTLTEDDEITSEVS